VVTVVKRGTAPVILLQYFTYISHFKKINPLDKKG